MSSRARSILAVREYTRNAASRWTCGTDVPGAAISRWRIWRTNIDWCQVQARCASCCLQGWIQSANSATSLLQGDVGERIAASKMVGRRARQQCFPVPPTPAQGLGTGRVFAIEPHWSVAHTSRSWPFISGNGLAGGHGI